MSGDGIDVQQMKDFRCNEVRSLGGDGRIDHFAQHQGPVAIDFNRAIHPNR